MERLCSVWNSADGVDWILGYSYPTWSAECGAWDHRAFGQTASSAVGRGKQVSTDNGETWVWLQPPFEQAPAHAIGVVSTTNEVLYAFEESDGKRYLWIERFTN